MPSFNPISLPFTGKIPEKIIVSDVGMCTRCFSQWTVQNGCSNPKCPEIVYREQPSGT